MEYSMFKRVELHVHVYGNKALINPADLHVDIYSTKACQN
jgi:hypothetical protein